MDGTFPQAGPLLFAWAATVVVLAGWLWRAGHIPDKYVAAVDAGLVPVIGAGTLLVAREDLASLVLVIGVSLPLAVFMYRVAVPFLDGLLAAQRSELPAPSLNEWLSGRPSLLKLPVTVLLALVFAAPSVLVLVLYVMLGGAR